MVKLSKRQLALLKIIVEDYTTNIKPLSSGEIINKYLPNVSSATIRNDMADLEKKGLLEKIHSSSGKYPSTEGYKYYELNILKPKSENCVKEKLEKIFQTRDLSIDIVIDQSIQIITDTLKLPSIISKYQDDAILRRFDLVMLDDNNALIILITSDGKFFKKNISFNFNQKHIEDVSTCIRVFNDRLVGTQISDLEKKMNSIKEIIRAKVHEYEFCIKVLFENLFNINNLARKNSIIGTKWLTKQPEFQNINKLSKVLEILEDSNVWKLISYNNIKTGSTAITFGDDVDKKMSDLAIATTSIDLGDHKHELAIVGPTRMNYSKVKWLLDFLKNEIEKKIDKTAIK